MDNDLKERYKALLKDLKENGSLVTIIKESLAVETNPHLSEPKTMKGCSEGEALRLKFPQYYALFDEVDFDEIPSTFIRKFIENSCPNMLPEDYTK